ncbi:MAG: methyl-accepting chemotaxis protein, partial [Pseudomonadota bacterium]
MRNWSVSKRIFLGFGAVLGLVAALAGVSYVATAQLSTIFYEYRATARQSLMVSDFVEDLFEARLAALKYRIAPSDSAASEVPDNLAEITQDISRLDELFYDDAAARAELERIGGSAAAYQEAFTALRGLKAERVSLVAATQSHFAEVATGVAALITGAAGAQAPSLNAAFAELLAAQTDLLALREGGRDEALNRLSAHLLDAGALIRPALQSEVARRSTDRRRAVESALASLEKLQTSASGLARIDAQVLQVAANGLDRIGPQMQADYERAVDAIIARQNRLGPEGAALTAQTLWVVKLVAALSLLIGAGLALLIARSVTTSVRRMAADMRALSQDDLDVEIRGAEQSHELGLMAQALVVFKQNALEVRRLAAEKAQADAALAEDRQRMMAELQSAFGAVVAAAVKGDFSVRAPENFADAELNDLAAGVNRLLDTVGEGVDETGRVLAQVAAGNLRERMGGEFDGAFDDLRRNVNDTVERLAELVGQIASTTESVSHSAAEITEGADDLASRAEQQASSLEQTAATMEEMSASIKSNADSSSSANSLAAEATARAASGGEIVQGAVAAMNGIESSARQIADIISVIDGIAFQTNLLALNAAVEAARAGDAGKGFAVVASEVRALAQRSSEASRDIRQLIETSAQQVASGVALVTETGASLDGIVAAIAQVEEAIGAIASASVEQAASVQEISAAISHMDQMTQQNASVAEESASNARELEGGARRLGGLIAYFDLGERPRAQNSQTNDGAEAAVDACW